MQGYPSWSKGQGLGPCDVGLRAFESLPLHFMLIPQGGVYLKIIAFTGMPFSGKSEAVKIAREMGMQVVRMGDVVWEEVKKRGLKVNYENVGYVANEMREKHGKDVWAKKTIEKLKRQKPSEFFVIDGLRCVEEMNVFKKMLTPNFFLISIEASEEVRHKRALNRNRLDDIGDFKKIKERDKRELEWGLDKLISSSDIKISNENDISVFRKQVEEVLKKIKKQ